jgi:hypothetical protein
MHPLWTPFNDTKHFVLKMFSCGASSKRPERSARILLAKGSHRVCADDTTRHCWRGVITGRMIVCVASYEGGIGKTTTAIHVAAFMQTLFAPVIFNPLVKVIGRGTMPKPESLSHEQAAS